MHENQPLTNKSAAAQAMLSTAAKYNSLSPHVGTYIMSASSLKLSVYCCVAVAKPAVMPAPGHVPFAIKKMKLPSVKPPVRLTENATAVLEDNAEMLPTRRQTANPHISMGSVAKQMGSAGMCLCACISQTTNHHLVLVLHDLIFKTRGANYPHLTKKLLKCLQSDSSNWLNVYACSIRKVSCAAKP